MSLTEKIDNDLKSALKSKDELRLNVTRMLKSDLRYKQIELGHELTDDDIIGVLSTSAKKRREAADEYNRAGRSDLEKRELDELHVIQEYLPQQLTLDELNLLIANVINEVNAKSIKDLGSVMKALMPKVKGRADGKIIQTAVKSRLEAM